MVIKTNAPFIKSNDVLEVRNVHKIYTRGKTKINALNGVNLSVVSGELISIMGPSGSGKTTLLNLISALDKPTKGKIYINRKEIGSMNDAQLTRLRRFEIGFIFQFYNLIPVLSCFENIELPLIIAGVKKKERELRVLDLVEKLRLQHRINHKPDELSGGEQQRTAIARALVNKPSIILADELTGDLDSKTGDEVMEYIKILNDLEQQTFIIVTHNEEVAKMTSKIYKIYDGKIVE